MIKFFESEGDEPVKVEPYKEYTASKKPANKAQWTKLSDMKFDEVVQLLRENAVLHEDDLAKQEAADDSGSEDDAAHNEL